MQLILALMLFVLKTVGLTYPPIWMTSPYVQASSKTVFSSYTTSGTIYTTTFTFGSAFSGLPKIGYGFKAYKGTYKFIIGDDYISP